MEKNQVIAVVVPTVLITCVFLFFMTCYQGHISPDCVSLQQLQIEQLQEQSSRIYLESQLNDLKTKVEKQALLIESMELNGKEHPAVRGEATSNATFFGKLRDDIAHWDALQMIKFDKQITNNGNDYSEITGTFRSSKSGLYLFSVTLVSDGCGETGLVLFQNKDPIFIVTTGASNHTQSASEVAVLNVKVNDEIYVTTENIFSCAVIEEETSFAAVLLHAN